MYKIDPARLTAHATAMTDDASSTATATSYASDHMTLQFIDTSFVYAKALFAVNETVEALNSYFGALNTPLTASATELQGTATRSLELDDSIEADLDRSYPDGAGRGATTPAGMHEMTALAHQMTAIAHRGNGSFRKQDRRDATASAH